MTPIRFGAQKRQLFGLHQPPTGGMEQAECILLCNPFGQEAIRCHRLFRVLAERLSRNGFHVLRFDYFGTGDSDGDDTEGDLAAWTDDVLTAGDEILRLSGCTGSSWFGLRLGATLAGLASIKGEKAPRTLVFWDPVIDGAAYLGDLANAHIATYQASYGARWKLEAGLREKASAESMVEAMGFPLPNHLQNQLRELSPSSLHAAKAQRLALFVGRSSQNTGELQRQLSARGIDVLTMAIETEIVWASNEAMNSSIVPAEALERITDVFLKK